MKRIAIYCRVSTDDQTNDPQRKELTEYCARRGWENVREYSDKISGAKWTRIGLDLLMRDVRARKLDVVVCVKLDRLGRSLVHLAQLVGELDSNRVALICTSQGIDTTDDNPMGKAMRGMLMVFAEFERDMNRERTRAGLASAAAQGRKGGRPRFKLTPAKKEILSKSRDMTIAEVAKALGCSVGTAHALVTEAEAPQ
jgi:DNA invertase Pin-like site-specific DNA recombinase